MKRFLTFCAIILGLSILFMPSGTVYAEDKTDISKAEIKLAASTKTYDGTEQTPGVTVYLDGNVIKRANYTVDYENNIDAGTAKVKVTGTGSYTGTASAAFTIKPAPRTPQIEISDTYFVYNGSEQHPKVLSVKVGTDHIKLDSSEYTVKYPKNSTDVGNYTLTVSLKGNYTGSNVKRYNIKERSIHGAVIKLSKQTFTYNGKKCRPDVTVTLDGVKLKKGTDFTVAYKTNKNAGHGDVQITGIGNYKHKSNHYSFLIRKAVQKFKVSAKSKTIKIKFSDLEDADQYLKPSGILKIKGAVGKVTYELGYKSANYFSMDSDTGKIQVKKDTPKGTYTLTLRVCAEGDKNHVKCYQLVNVKIKVK